MADKAFESEELRLFHKACREGRAVDIANAKSISPDMLNSRSVVTGRTVRSSSTCVAGTEGSPYAFRVGPIERSSLGCTASHDRGDDVVYHPPTIFQSCTVLYIGNKYTPIHCIKTTHFPKARTVYHCRRVGCHSCCGGPYRPSFCTRKYAEL